MYVANIYGKGIRNNIMCLKKKIEILREKLNNEVLNEKNLSKANIVKISEELDKLIVEYLETKICS